MWNWQGLLLCVRGMMMMMVKSTEVRDRLHCSIQTSFNSLTGNSKRRWRTEKAASISSWTVDNDRRTTAAWSLHGRSRQVRWEFQSISDFTSRFSAVQYGYYDRVVELIEPNPSLATTPTNGNITLLHWAAINNRTEIAEYLLSKNAQVDALGGELRATPLHWAARNGKLPMVVYLLSRQANVSLFDGEGKRTNERTKIIKNFNVFFSGFATIHLATMYGHTETVAYLIARGQEVDVFDENGMTPLMHAAEKVKQ